jgi:hypothetical protein
LAKVSRADLHVDWQGGNAPTLDGGSRELRAFIRPGKTKWGFYGQGLHPTRYTFGRGHVQARLYNKTLETREKANDAYIALLVARSGETFDPSLEVWRLEFQLRREGVKGFRLYAPPEADDEAEIEAELAAEELQHIGTLHRFFARLEEVFLHLTQHWLRLVVVEDETAVTNRSRLPLHPTWAALRQAFGAVPRTSLGWPLESDARQLVRGARYSGKSRILRRLALGVVASLEVKDASLTSAALLALQHWVERVAEAEVGRLTRRCAHYQDTLGYVPRWVDAVWGHAGSAWQPSSIECRCCWASSPPRVCCR